MSFLPLEDVQAYLFQFSLFLVVLVAAVTGVKEQYGDIAFHYALIVAVTLYAAALDLFCTQKKLTTLHRIHRFTCVVSFYQVLSDSYLANKLEMIHFFNLMIPHINVSVYMALGWCSTCDLVIVLSYYVRHLTKINIYVISCVISVVAFYIVETANDKYLHIWQVKHEVFSATDNISLAIFLGEMYLGPILIYFSKYSTNLKTDVIYGFVLFVLYVGSIETFLKINSYYSIVYAVFALVSIALLLPVENGIELPANYYKSGGKTFLITGCASGVGKHMAGVLLAHGHFVCATDINEKTLKENAAHWSSYKDKLKVIKLDVCSPDNWRSVLEEIDRDWKRLDVCLNVAGYLHPGYTQDMTDSDVNLHFDVNVKGMIFGTKLAAALMKRHLADGSLRQGAHIVNFASIAAFCPCSGLALYLSSKYAVRGFTLAAAKDLAADDIYLTCFCPDAIATPMVEKQLHFQESAITLSAPWLLSVNDVERSLMEHVLVHRPREVVLPTEFFRGKLARLSDWLHDSRLMSVLEERIRQIGVNNQERIKKDNSLYSS